MTVTVSPRDSGKAAIVRVTNQTGHKLPTGYPEGRQMWIHFQAFDTDGNLVYESGAYDATEHRLVRDADVQVFEAKQGISQDLARLLGREPGESFHFILNNVVVKDNRIPPRGYTQAAFDQPGLRPVGVTCEDGQYWSDKRYALPATAVRVRVTLYYQTASREYVEFLRDNGGVDGEALNELWQGNPSPPQVMERAWWPRWPAYLPLIFKGNRAPE
jgi:hypothetical protein